MVYMGFGFDMEARRCGLLEFAPYIGSIWIRIIQAGVRSQLMVWAVHATCCATLMADELEIHG